jgi:hypothetical protein
MKPGNSMIRYMIQTAVVLIMIMSLPVKLFNIFFQWREQKQLKLTRKSTKDMTIEHSKFYS